MHPKISIIIPVYNVEKYIEKMLMSVKQQSFRDYEVIIINDGSTDGSQAIIDMFCEADGRFKTIVKENGGVASARNMGLENATGEFVVFYDPDDYIPKNALKKMYRSIKKNNADIAIGIMKEVHPSEERYNSHTIKLSKKNNISMYDLDLVGTFSVCNKIFRREMIVGNNITFHKIKHTEDAVFSFQCYFAAKKICGSRGVAYEYHFRPFWESQSATQRIDLEHLNDLIAALTMLEELVEKQICLETGNSYDKANQMLQELYYRNLQSNIINGFYRRLWKAEIGVLDSLLKQIDKYKLKLSDGQWETLLRNNADLKLDEKENSIKHLSKNALVTFVIDEIKDFNKINIVLDAIYDQSMPMFNLLINEKYRDYIETNKMKENIVFSSTCNLKEVETEFVCFVDENIISSKNAVRFMVYALLKNNNFDYATVPIKEYKEGVYIRTLQQTAFTLLQCVKNKKSKYDEFDCQPGNKVIRREKAYTQIKNLKRKKVYSACMIAIGEIDTKIASNLNTVNYFRVAIKRFQKSLEDKLISYIKSHYTKEDIRRLLRKEI